AHRRIRRRHRRSGCGFLGCVVGEDFLGHAPGGGIGRVAMSLNTDEFDTAFAAALEEKAPEAAPAPQAAPPGPPVPHKQAAPDAGQAAAPPKPPLPSPSTRKRPTGRVTGRPAV